MKPDVTGGGDPAGLWREFKERGNAEARSAIAIHYLGLVRIIAGKMAMTSPPHVDRDDLIGWGVLGLLDAVDKFDPARNIAFETYASTRIRGAIIDQIRSLDWAPRSLRRKARELEQASEALQKKLGRKPDDAELAKELGIDESGVFELKADIHGSHFLSLEAGISGDPQGGDISLGDVLSDDSAPSPDREVLRKEREESLAEAIAKLPENERKVITLYYYDELTLREIGQILELTESRICQIHRAVIGKLRNYLEADFLT